MDTTVLAALLEHSPNPTWLTDSDGRCVYANQELREITALSAAKFGDLNWLELVAEEDRQMSSTLWQEARIHHQPYRARFFLCAGDCARGSAVEEARRNGLISAEDAANLSDIPNVRQRGSRLGDWLTREQAKELLQVPDRSTLKGKRDYAILALLVGCALRRRELAALAVSHLRSDRPIVEESGIQK
jgi:PAS domain S-box-containing protein